MTFRERIKRAFRSSSPTSSLSKTSSQRSEKNKDSTWPSNVYAPGEPMPRPKYRAPVKKEHKEKLESFNWGTAWRRRSHISEYSPMGSRMPSRRGSLLSRKSFGGKSRRGSFAEKNARESTDGKDQGGRGVDGVQMKSRHAARPTRLSAEIEAEGDDDVTNVGLSRVQSRDKDKTALSRQLSAAENPLPGSTKPANGTSNQLDTTLSHAYDHQPFTEEELALAMKRSHLTVPTQS